MLIQSTLKHQHMRVCEMCYYHMLLSHAIPYPRVSTAVTGHYQDYFNRCHMSSRLFQPLSQVIIKIISTAVKGHHQDCFNRCHRSSSRRFQPLSQVIIKIISTVVTGRLSSRLFQPLSQVIIKIFQGVQTSFYNAQVSHSVLQSMSHTSHIVTVCQLFNY